MGNFNVDERSNNDVRMFNSFCSGCKYRTVNDFGMRSTFQNVTTTKYDELY